MAEMFKKILIANRGEIAVRIARTAHQMGIDTVSVYAEDDHDSLHIKSTGESYSLGSGSLKDTILNFDKILDIAKSAGCDAIHPGYGFLSENPAFAEACSQNGITFIGPSAEIIRLMGSKPEANRYVRSLGIPVLENIPVTGSYHELGSVIPHFPLLIKASSGGGGRGMRIVKALSELQEAVESSLLEASSAFGDGTVYIERLLHNPRHIEVQILGDNFGNVIHLYERECSLQRRYQKIIEETPAFALSQPLRENITGAAVKIARSVRYSGAGTIEFLIDQKGNFFFLEMNTRIQVEHPVTEMITGIDIVREQIQIAMNKKLGYLQEEISITGHAIESRIYAENPSDFFRPSPGRVLYFHYPESDKLRVDTGIESGYEVKYQHDPMLAKIIAHGLDRSEAIRNLQAGLSETILHGIDNNLNFLKVLLADSSFVSGEISTTYIEENIKRLVSECRYDLSQDNFLFLIAAALIIKPGEYKSQAIENELIWYKIGLWRHLLIITVEMDKVLFDLEISSTNNKRILLCFDNKEFDLYNVELIEHQVSFEYLGVKYQVAFSEGQSGEIWLTYKNHTLVIKRKDMLYLSGNEDDSGHDTGDDKSVFSPMHGKILKVLVSENSEIIKNDTLLVIDSMKTENKILAPSSGKISRLFVTEGDQVKTNMLLAEIE